MYEKAKDEEYKTNLIYSILMGEEAKVRIQNSKTSPSKRYNQGNNSMLEFRSSRMMHKS
jgi:hypothetical protein